MLFRSLIGYDKEEIIKEAKQIGTFDISILPHDDCCSLLMPKNPATRARAVDLAREEVKLDVTSLVGETLKNTELVILKSPASSRGGCALGAEESRTAPEAHSPLAKDVRPAVARRDPSRSLPRTELRSGTGAPDDT